MPSPNRAKSSPCAMTMVEDDKKTKVFRHLTSWSPEKIYRAANGRVLDVTILPARSRRNGRNIVTARAFHTIPAATGGLLPRTE